VPDAIGMVLAFYRLVLEHTLSEEERSQILQTIEMFEVITQTQHDDYQSLEILKVGSVGTLALLDRSVTDAARFLMASTSEAYGDPLVHPQPETYWGNVNPIGLRSM